MSAGLVARRYAKALFKVCNYDLAAGRALQSPLATIGELFEQNDAGKILRSPAMPLDLKKSLLDYALKAGNATNELKAFCDMIVDAGRVELVPDVIAVFGELLDEAEGTMEAEVTSAGELSSSDRTTIEGLVAGVVGKKIKLNTTVDQDLLGGFVVNVGNFKIDMSLKTRLDGLATQAAAR